MKPSQTILGPISSLSPEFSDLSMETDSAGKRRERSASLVGASREHRAREPHSDTPGKSPNKSPMRAFLNRKKVMARMRDLFKEPTKGVQRAVGGQLKQSTITGGLGLGFQSIRDRSKSPIKEAKPSDLRVRSPFPTFKSIFPPAYTTSS
jgi:hypothetical protein